MIFAKSFYAAVLAAFAGTAVAYSAEAVFSTVGDSEKYEMWGTRKAEAYDVAVRLDNAALIGKKLTGARIPLATSDVITDISVWLTSELTLENKVNVPDIVSVQATSVDGAVEVSFPEAYEIPEQGVYLGVSFTTEGEGNVASYPVTTVKMTGDCGFYIHSKRTYLKWKDLSSSEGRVVAMYARIDGDINPADVSVVEVASAVAQVDTPFSIPVTLRNCGAERVTSIDYAVTVDGVATDYHAEYEYGILPYYLGLSSLYLPVNGFDNVGRNIFSFKVTKVNGLDNVSASGEAEGYVDIAEFCPVNRPLLEEYTGLGCGWCPRGIAAFERMYSLYPGLFVGAAFHEGDDMTALGQRPNSPSGQPAAYLNRTVACDPYCGTDLSGFGIEQLWLDAQQESVPVDVRLSLEWADETKSILRASADVVYVAECDRNVAIAYLLLADDISDKVWVQSNYYSGASGQNYIPEMQQFFEGDALIVGMKFNDIVAMQSAPKGVEGSLPSVIVPYETYSHSYTFNLADAVSTKGFLLAQHPDKLKVVAIVVDADSGEAINCNFASTAELASVEGLMSAGGSTVVWYDLSGRRVINPADGLFIKVETDGRGAVKASKIKTSFNKEC